METRLPEGALANVRLALRRRQHALALTVLPSGAQRFINLMSLRAQELLVYEAPLIQQLVRTRTRLQPVRTRPPQEP